MYVAKLRIYFKEYKIENYKKKFIIIVITLRLCLINIII